MIQIGSAPAQRNWSRQEIKQLEIDGVAILDGLGDMDLGRIYAPVSQAVQTLQTHVPDSMAPETTEALERIKGELGGDFDNFVRQRLGYPTKEALYAALAAEQIDAVAVGIYNIEAKEQGFINGDQTGIGKGRSAAAMIRYAVRSGLKPIFFTEKANLFSDLYRDLVAIGSGDLRPFIINGKEDKSEIKNEAGDVVFSPLSQLEQTVIFEGFQVPDGFDYVLTTYSQFSSPYRKPTKPDFVREIAKNNVLILDECHNATGSGNTGYFIQSLIESAKGVTFLSATFAKRPDNMPIYAMKTAICESNVSKASLSKAIARGGVPLQEIVASQLVSIGQMMRRERSYEGIEVNYIYLNQHQKTHSVVSDSITKILRDIVNFQVQYVKPVLASLNAAYMKKHIQFTSEAKTFRGFGVNNMPYFGKVFNVINQMLFAIKAEAVANHAIARLQQGQKPVIAFSSTMGGVIEQMENEDGEEVKDGDTIRADFSAVLSKGLTAILKYSITDKEGKKVDKAFNLKDLGQDATIMYNEIKTAIDTVSSGISISPIDQIIQKIEEAGFTVAEVTGRRHRVELKGEKGIVRTRKRMLTNDAFRRFNDNEIDVLLINQAGSTGASAHAIPTAKVPASKVKQRVMIVLQADLDISTEIQKRGRINRTGQVHLPIYDYIISPIPAEQRLMMMMQKKLKSLDANTTSNQRQSSHLHDVPDFLNRYGDRVVAEYLVDNPQINKMLDYPLAQPDYGKIGDGAHKVSGRVAILSTQMQAAFYTEMTERYNDYVEFLKQMGEYDLEVEVLDLKTETLRSSLYKVGKGGDSPFGQDSVLETVEANVLRKPYRAHEVENLMKEALKGREPDEVAEDLIKSMQRDFIHRIETELDEINAYYDNLIRQIPEERKIKRLEDKPEQYGEAIDQRMREIQEQRLSELRMAQSGTSHRANSVLRIMEFFTVGKKLRYPLSDSVEDAMAICLGVMLNMNKKNPYARSAIKVRLAIANSIKYVTIPASNDDLINKIMALNLKTETPERSELLIDWEEEVMNRSTDRSLRYIISGNLLQAFDDDKGKLVSYTTMDNEVKKGILKPDGWEPDPERLIKVPILKCLKVLHSMINNASIQATDGISFFKAGDSYRIVLPKSRRDSELATDPALLSLLYENKMTETEEDVHGIILGSNLEKVAEILQRRYSISLRLKDHQLNWVDTSKTVIGRRNPIVIPEQVNEKELERIRILELEAEAIAIALGLGL